MSCRFIFQRDLNPYVFEGVGNLTEKLVNGFETICQHLVDPVFD